MKNIISRPGHWSDEDRHIMRFVIKPVLNSISEIIIQEKTNEMRNSIKNEIHRALTEKVI